MVTISIKNLLFLCSALIFFYSAIYFQLHLTRPFPEACSQNSRLEGVEARLKEVEWRLHMRVARDFPGISYPLENGLASKCIPEHLLPRFGTGDFIGHSKPDPPLPPEHSASQVGQFVFDHMELRGSRPVWTAEIWDHLMERQARGESITVPAYPGSTEDLNAVLPHVMKYRADIDALTLDAAVFSAISPWGEAVIRKYFPAGGKVKMRLVSVDFNPCIIDGIPSDQLAECQDVLALKGNSGPTLDLIFSFSGVEHDGLGRYGDPVNPDGDIAALREFWLHLRPGGFALFAVPTSTMNTRNSTNGVFIDHWGNGHLRVMRHRVFGVKRLKKIFTGFTVLGYGKNGEYHTAGQNWEDDGVLMNDRVEQPIFVLQKDASMSFEDILHAQKSIP